MIAILVCICFAAILAYCLIVTWPRQTGRRAGGLRPHHLRTQRSLYDLDGHNRSTDRPRLLKH